MRKLFTLTFAVILIIAIISAISVSAHAANVDLSGMSYNDLVGLKDSINSAIWNSSEWEEVEVPQGVYIVGQHIPAGHWTILPKEGYWCSITAGTGLNDAQTRVDNMKRKGGFTLVSKTSDIYDDGDQTSGDIVLESGWYIEISDSPAIFTPYNGKSSFSFKNGTQNAASDSSYYEDYLVIEDFSVYQDGTDAYIEGKSKNIGTEFVELAKYRCTFLVETDGEVIATEYAYVTDIGPGESVSFTVTAPYDARMHAGKATLIDVYMGGKW